MGRKRHAFKENDAARAIRAARKAGIEHPVVEIDTSTGKITIRVGAPPQASPSPQPASPQPHTPDDWDKALGMNDNGQD